MEALSNIILARAQTAAKRAALWPEDEQSTLPGKWSVIVPTPLTKEMSKMVLGKSGHGYTSHALNKFYLDQALE
eukprot:12579111-Heterocapsa_arctica.AAC.1